MNQRIYRPARASVNALCLVVVVFGIALHAEGQPFGLSWWKVAGGGGTSSGGGYAISGTVGQHDAGGAMSGGGYALTGGFWAIYAVQTLGAPSLGIFATTTNTVVVYWPNPSTGWVLQQKSDVGTSVWSNVGTPFMVVGDLKEVIVSPPVGNRFYRLFHP